MSYSESQSKKIENCDPNSLFYSYNRNLPGQPLSLIKIAREPISPPTPIRIFLSFRSDLPFPFPITDLSLLSTCISKFARPSQDYFAVCGGPFIKIFNNADLNCLQTYELQSPNDQFLCLAWGVIGKNALLAAGCASGNVHILDPINNKSSEKILEGHYKKVTSLIFMPKDSCYVFSASEDHSIRFWNISKGINAIFRGHILPVLALDINFSGDLLVSAGADTRINLWSLRPLIDNIRTCGTAKPNHEIVQFIKPVFSDNTVHLGFVDCVKFLGNLIISKDNRGDILIWKPTGENNYPVSVIKQFCLNTNYVIGMKFSISPNNKLLCVGNETSSFCVFQLDWSVDDTLLYSEQVGQTPILSPLISDNTVVLFTEKTVKVYDYAC
jgi:WD40 repeat protein